MGDIGKTVVPRRVFEPEPEQVPFQSPDAEPAQPQEDPVLVPA